MFVRIFVTIIFCLNNPYRHSEKHVVRLCILIYKCTFPNFHCCYCYYDGLALIHLAITINKELWGKSSTSIFRASLLISCFRSLSITGFFFLCLYFHNTDTPNNIFVRTKREIHHRAVSFTPLSSLAFHSFFRVSLCLHSLGSEK